MGPGQALGTGLNGGKKRMFLARGLAVRGKVWPDSTPMQGGSSLYICLNSKSRQTMAAKC